MFQLIIRKYTHQDKSSVIELLQQNTPDFFDPSEEKDFKYYLAHEIEDYFVIEQDNQVIGSGGINYFPKNNTAKISWDFIAPKFQGKGIGKKLTEYRIEYLKKKTEIKRIIVRTSQFTYLFYEKLGFKLEKIEKDFWAKGYDLYQMKMNNE